MCRWWFFRSHACTALGGLMGLGSKRCVTKCDLASCLRMDMASIKGPPNFIIFIIHLEGHGGNGNGSSDDGYGGMMRDGNRWVHVSAPGNLHAAAGFGNVTAIVTGAGLWPPAAGIRRRREWRWVQGFGSLQARFQGSAMATGTGRASAPYGQTTVQRSSSYHVFIT
ncbi:hypothetical protein BJV74DRAFT_796822 [Russula compacta]|nr:hypothetical protein BJV74DRAFT_796822 [Russula compacta]